MNTLSHIKQLFDLQLCCDGKPSAFILIKLLQTVTSEDVTAFICTSRYLKYFLMVCQKCLPEMNNSKLGEANSNEILNDKIRHIAN